MPDLKSVQSALQTHYHYFEIHEHKGDTLGQLLLKLLPEIDPDSWAERFAWGGVFINGQAAKGDLPVPVPCKIEYYEPKLPIAELKTSFPKFNKKQIVFEDQHLIAASKPAGLSCNAAKEQKHFSLYKQLTDYTQSTIHMPSRLDFSTAGLVLVSKTPDAHAALQKLFEQRRIKKYYILSIPAEHQAIQKIQVNNYIIRDPLHPVLRKTSEINGKRAITEFIFLKTLQQKHFYLALPETGRTHQIRVHSRYSLGSGISGDTFYDGQPAKQLELYSYAVKFVHPLSGMAMYIKTRPDLLPAWLPAELIQDIDLTIDSSENLVRKSI